MSKLSSRTRIPRASILDGSIVSRTRWMPAIACAVVGGLSLAPGARADIAFNPPDGNWNIASNWFPAQIPTSLDDVKIDNNGTAEIMTADASASTLRIGDFSNSSLQIFNGFTLSTVNTTLAGGSAPSSGTVIVNGGIWNSTGTLIVGASGTGALDINSGRVTAASIQLGGNSGNPSIPLGVGKLRIFSGGTLQVGGTDGIKMFTGIVTMTFAGGMLQVINSDLTTSVPLTLATGTNSTIDTNGFNATFSGVVSGAGALTKDGAGTLALTASNTFTGGTTVNAGKLLLGDGTNAASLIGGNGVGSGVGGQPAVTVNNAAIFEVNSKATVQGGSGYDGGAAVASGTGGAGVVLTNGGTLIVHDQASVTGGAGGGIADIAHGGGDGVFLSNGGSVTNAGTISGGTTRGPGSSSVGVRFTGAVGTLVNQSTGVINGGVVMDNFANDVTLETGGVVNGDLNIGTDTTALLTLTGSGTQAYSTAVTGTTTFSGAMVKDGTGTWSLDQAFTHSGGTTLKSGRLNINNNGALGSGKFTIEGGTVGTTYIGAVVGNAVSVQGDFSVATNIDPITPGTQNLAFTGPVDLGGATRIITGVTPGGQVTFAGGISNGGVTFNADSSVITDPANPYVAFTYSGTAANTYTGLTTVNSGVYLILNSSVANGAIAGDVDIEGTGCLDFFASNQLATTSNVTVNSVGGTVGGNAFTGFELRNYTQSINTLSGSGTVGLGSGTLTILDSGDFSGVIKDGDFGTGGNIVMDGYGPLILSGANTYTGSTTINHGVVVANNISGSATGTGPVIVGADGALGGSGKVGGPVTLNSGGYIVPGALSFGSAGTKLTVDSLTWNGGSTVALQLGATGDQLAITNALTKGTAGAYELDIYNAGITQSTYTLLTFGSTDFAVSDFTLALPAGYIGTLTETATALTLSLSINVTGSTIQNSAPVGTPTFANFFVGGPVTTGGPGENNLIRSLFFLPGGSLTVHNLLTVTSGPIDLVGGASIDLQDGSIKNPLLNVLAGGYLHGNGGILGNLFNAGLVSPGHSPGQIHVSGNYTQTSSGTLRIEIAGRDLSQHDLLSVDGTATLDGALQLVQLDHFKLKRNKPVTFLTAAGGVEGKFATVENEFTSDTILKPTVVYHPNSVALEAVQGSFAALDGLTPNQKAVARTLDSAAHDQRADAIFEYLDYRKLEKLPGDFDKIAPEELTSTFTIGTSLAKVQSGNIQRRNDDIRSGSDGFNAAGLAVNGTGPSYSGSFGLAGPSGPLPSDDGKAVQETKQVVAPAENRWGAFLSGTGEWVSVGNTDNARGYDLTSGGFTLGLDYKVTPNFAIGLAAGYTGSSADLTDRGRVYVNGGKLGLYATFFDYQRVNAAPVSSKDAKEVLTPSYNVAKGFYADVAVFGGYNSYDTRRSALQGEARGDTEGGELNVLAGIGYDFKKGNLTFGPTVSFNYTYLGTDAFTEHGSLAPLNIHGGKGESLRTAFGIKASYDWKVGSMVIKPEIRAAWQHEFGDAAYALDSDFANGAGGDFRVNGPEMGRDSALLGAGFAIQFNERFSTYFYYDGELGRKNYQSNSVTGGVRLAF